MEQAHDPAVPDSSAATLAEAEAAFLDAMEEAAAVATPEAFARLLAENRKIDARGEAAVRALETISRAAVALEDVRRGR